MYEEDLKQKYRKLKSKLHEISNEISELKFDLNSLNNFIENNISVNGDNPMENSMNEIIETTNSINEDIRNCIIPMINNKI